MCPWYPGSNISGCAFNSFWKMPELLLLRGLFDLIPNGFVASKGPLVLRWLIPSFLKLSRFFNEIWGLPQLVPAKRWKGCLFSWLLGRPLLRLFSSAPLHPAQKRTFFIFPYFGNNHPNWLIFFRGFETTNQIIWNYHGTCSRNIMGNMMRPRRPWR